MPGSISNSVSDDKAPQNLSSNDQSSTNQDSHHSQKNIAPSASIQSTLQSHDKSPPSNSIRQRSSNVASLSPDVEF